jgi:hypothetical protein
MHHSNFDELIEAVNSVRMVYIAPKWKLSTCTCRRWLKNYICNHVIAMSHRLGLHKFDDMVKKVTPLNLSRKIAKKGAQLAPKKQEQDRRMKIRKSRESHNCQHYEINHFLTKRVLFYITYCNFCKKKIFRWRLKQFRCKIK